MPVQAVEKLVASATEGRTFGVLGEPRVNVLELNLALDAQLTTRLRDAPDRRRVDPAFLVAPG